MRHFLALLVPLLLAFFVRAAADQVIRGDGFVLYCYDNATNTCLQDGSDRPAPQPLQILMGGGADVDDAFTEMIQRSGGGHFVIVRADDDAGYNEYVWQLANNGSSILAVTTLVVFSRTGASEPLILDRLAQASALFIAGGYQDQYMAFWNGTLLQSTLETLVGKMPLGGTSAGAMVQPQFVHTALGGMCLSDQALENPYNVNVTLGTEFLRNPFLSDVLVDTHFFQRDRFGRTMVFLARVLTDYPSRLTNGGEIRGVACSEQSSVIVVPPPSGSGIASVANETPGPEHACYFFYADVTSGYHQLICKPDVPLTFTNVSIFRASSPAWEGGQFDMVKWRPVAGSGGSSYAVSAVNGNLTSTQANGNWY